MQDLTSEQAPLLSAEFEKDPGIYRAAAPQNVASADTGSSPRQAKSTHPQGTVVTSAPPGPATLVTFI